MTGFNHGPLVSEATALPTEPQPLPSIGLILNTITDPICRNFILNYFKPTN